MRYSHLLYYQILMNTLLSYYCRLNWDIKHQRNIKIDEFRQVIKKEQHTLSYDYLSLLLINAVSVPMPKIQNIIQLIKGGANLNYVYYDPTEPSKCEGRNILMTASQNANSSCVSQLLKHQNIDIGVTDRNGENALHYAMRNPSQVQSIKIIKCILAKISHQVPHNVKQCLLSSAQKHQKDNMAKLLFKKDDATIDEQPQNLCKEKSQKCSTDRTSAETQNIISAEQQPDKKYNSRMGQDLQYQIQQYSLMKYSQFKQAELDIRGIQIQLQNLGMQRNLYLNSVGSFATQLWTKCSDINFIFFGQGINFCQLLQDIYDRLYQEKQNLQIREIYLNINQKVPNIRLILPKQLNNRTISIKILNHQPKYDIKYIKEPSQFAQIIKFIFYTFHGILEQFKLHQLKYQGLKTQVIYLMISQFIQKKLNNKIDISISRIFIQFINYYGDKLSQGNQDIIDPNNQFFNIVRKNINFQKLRILFKTVSHFLSQAKYQKDTTNILYELFQFCRQKYQNYMKSVQR